MSVFQTLRSGALARVNPVAKLAVIVITSTALLLTIDWVSATVALVLECVLISALRLPWRILAVRLMPLVVAAILAGFTTALYGRSSGHVWFQWWSIVVTDGSLSLAAATTLRILAIGIPALVLFMTIDPTDLADGLAQIVHLPARFVLGALAAFRLMGLFVDDWRTLELARRARGVADSGRLRRMLGQVFALLVLSIRRGSKVATAMEARGFGGTVSRTWARQSRLSARDWIVIGLGVIVAATAVSVAVATGSWNSVIG